MKTIEIEIKKGQMMKDIIPIMQTNTIYNKGIPGIGATTLEIDAKRNSIIVLPFVPVIEGKELDKEGNLRTDLIGVYSEINSERVAEYIESRDKKTKKILCTPEKLKMVIETIRGQDQNPFESYFLLVDECETIVKDIDFRKNIKVPMEYFFDFVNKAMVSATPIIPRDSRFERENFTYVKIIPHKRWKSYRVDLDLRGTNNVVSVLRSYIKEHPEETLCIFTNCSKTITKIIADLRIEKEAKVFCAHRLIVKRFKATNIKNTYTSLKDSKDGLAKVNFFTSRFFSAVDMIFPKIKPHIIMVTNIYYSEHSKIDPATDAIQISGRFRKGIKKLVHISNFNTDIPLITKQELKREIDELLLVYKYLNKFKDHSDSTKHRANWINEIFKHPPFIKMMTNGKLDTYLADNIQHQKFVTSYYSNFMKLRAAYAATNYFNVSHSFKYLKVTDEDIMKRDAVAGTKRRKEIARMLHEYTAANGPFNLDSSYYEELSEFFLMDETVYTAYFDLGLDFMEDVKYQLKALKRGLLNKGKEKMKVSELIMEAVFMEFNRNETVTNNEARIRLQTIYNQYSDIPVTASGTDIKLYFEVTECHNIKRYQAYCRGYRLGQPKFPYSNKLINRNAHIKF